MTYYFLFPLFSLIANFLLAFHIIYIDSKKIENRLFFMITLSIAFWSFSHFIMFSTTDASIALFWAQFDTWGSTFTAVFTLHFFVVYTETKHSGFKKYILFVLYIIAMIFGFLDYSTYLVEKLPELHYWGYFSAPGSLYILPSIFIIVCIITGLFLTIKYYFKSKLEKEKKQALLLIIAISIPLVGGIVTESIPTIFDFEIIPLTTTLTTFMAIIISYTMRKYKLMTTTEYQLKTVEKLFNTLPNAIVLFTEKGRICEINEAMAINFGVSKERLIGKNIYNLLPKNVDEKRRSLALEALKSGKIKKNEDQIKHRFFHNLFIPTKSIGDENNILMISNEITERKKAEEQIKKDLEEKNILLKEIHHRVKNNLQIMRSLIHLQKLRETNPEFQAYATNLSNRIYSMALIHEQLYRSENMAEISLKQYLESFLTKILSSYKCPHIIIEKKIKDVYLSLDKSVPIGLIINELIINAMQHAFPKNRKGKIILSLSCKENMCELQVQDNGIGIPARINFKEPITLGLKLVNILTEQLDGTVQICQQKGTSIKLYFPNFTSSLTYNYQKQNLVVKDKSAKK